MPYWNSRAGGRVRKVRRFARTVGILSQNVNGLQEFLKASARPFPPSTHPWQNKNNSSPHLSENAQTVQTSQLRSSQRPSSPGTQLKDVCGLGVSRRCPDTKLKTSSTCRVEEFRFDHCCCYSFCRGAFITSYVGNHRQRQHARHLRMA